MLTLLNQSWWNLNFFLAQTEPGSAELSAEEAAAVGGLFLIITIIGIVAYIYTSFTLQVICKRLEVENAWLAWVPVGNIYITLKAGDNESPVLWTVLWLIPLINLVSFYMFVKAWINIVKKLGKSPWIVLLFLVPLVNIALPAYLAFSH